LPGSTERTEFNLHRAVEVAVGIGLIAEIRSLSGAVEAELSMG
jgi:hypothetical protein